MVALARREIEKALQKLEPELRIGSRSAEEAWSLAWSIPAESGHGRTRLGLGSLGRDEFRRLQTTLEGSEGARQYWGPTRIEELLKEKLGLLATKAVTPKQASADLCSEIEHRPPERTVILPLFGIVSDEPFDICGLGFRKPDPVELAREFALSGAEGAMLGAQLHSITCDLVVAARLSADHERAATIVRSRLDLAVPFLFFTVGEDAEEFLSELTLGVSSETEVGAVSFAEEAVSGAFEPQDPGSPVTQLRIKSEALRTALLWTGPKALHELGKSLPLRQMSSVQRRIIRASRRLTESFRGSANDRYIRRWMAVEALLGDRSGELVERLADRAAVVYFDDADKRIDQRSAIKRHYGYRSALAHGGEDPRIEVGHRLWMRLFAMRILGRIAGAGLATDEELFGAIDRAKFRGEPFGGVPNSAEA